MYRLKFTKLPKAIKKHLKDNKVWQKSYALSEANVLFSQAVFASQVTGEVVVTIACPTGEPEYEFRVRSDSEQSLSVQVLKDFDAFLDNKQAEIEGLYHDAEENKDKIKILEDDILILTNRAKEIREEFADVEKTSPEQDEYDEPQEIGVQDAIIEECDEGGLHEPDLFADVTDPELMDDLFSDVDDDEFEPEPSVEPEPSIQEKTFHKAEEVVDLTENKMHPYLDVSTIDAIGKLENQVKKLDGQIEQGIDRYLFDELYLASATDFSSQEKKELIRTKHLPQANQTFQSMRDWARKSLEEIKRFSKAQLQAKHAELNALKTATRKQRVTEMAEILKVTFDKRKGVLKKEIIEKRDAEILEMEIALDEERNQRLAMEAEKIEQALAKGFNTSHEKELSERRKEVEKIASDKASVVFETIDKGYEGLLHEIKSNLNEYEKDIETRYQLYRADQKDAFTQDISNRELQLRMRQLDIEEKKLSKNNETRLLSEQVEQLKMTLEKNRLEDQMQLMARDKADQNKELERFKKWMGFAFLVMGVAMTGVIAHLL